MEFGYNIPVQPEDEESSVAWIGYEKVPNS